MCTLFAQNSGGPTNRTFKPIYTRICIHYSLQAGEGPFK